MARAGAAIGTPLQWIAVDQHDTDNPHTHIIIRGRRANGQDLLIQKDFVKHGFRDVARDAATEWVGPRSPADEHLALDREVFNHAPTRLDRMIEAQLTEGRTIRITRLDARKRQTRERDADRRERPKAVKSKVLDLGR
jgi:type IV secretory pathway VirD2 relaxase